MRGIAPRWWWLALALSVRGVALGGPGEAAVYTVEVYPVLDLLRPPGAERWGADPATVSAELARLVGQIRAVVQPRSWGDARASITADGGGRLTVAQTPEGHAALHRWLAALRAHRAVRVRIRTRLFLYHLADTQVIVSRFMRLDEVGPARVVLDPGSADRLAAALAGRRDVIEVSAPSLTLVSGGHAYVSVGTETAMSTTWRPHGGGGRRPATAPMALSVFDGQSLVVGATASADRRSVMLDVSPTATRLAGDRPMEDAFGRIDLPEFAVSTVCVSADVPAGHTLLVGGLRTKVEAEGAAGAQSWRQQREAAVLLLVTPNVEDPAGPLVEARQVHERSHLDLEALAVLGRLRQPAPPAAAGDLPSRPAPDLTRVTITSPDGLVTLDLELGAGDVDTPAVGDWLRRLLGQPGLKVERGGGGGD